MTTAAIATMATVDAATITCVLFPEARSRKPFEPVSGLSKNGAMRDQWRAGRTAVDIGAEFVDDAEEPVEGESAQEALQAFLLTLNLDDPHARVMAVSARQLAKKLDGACAVGGGFGG